MTNLKQLILDNVHITWDELVIFDDEWCTVCGDCNDISFWINKDDDKTTVKWITSDNYGVITQDQQNLSLEEAKHLCKEYVSDYLLKFLNVDNCIEDSKYWGQMVAANFNETIKQSKMEDKT